MISSICVYQTFIYFVVNLLLSLGLGQSLIYLFIYFIFIYLFQLNVAIYITQMISNGKELTKLN